MIRPLSVREKWLTGIVGLIVLIGANVFLIESYWHHRARLRAEIESKGQQLHLMQMLTGELTFWAGREEWLKATQPLLTGSDTAGVQLLNRIKDLAKKHAVLLESPAIRPPDKQPAYVSVAIEIETKSAWQPLIAFLQELQSPEQFIALENANLKIDPNDSTQMRGRFKIARWYAPQ